MFGLTTFSQSPFTSLGGISASVIENIITETDSESVVATFITVISEAITLADSVVGGYNVIAIENTNLTDSNVGVGNFVGSIAEVLNPTDTPSVVAAFTSIISEPNTLIDSPAGGWNVVVTENASYVDSPTGFGTFVYGITESISSFTDVESATSALPVNIIEALSSFSESSIGLPTFAVSVSEGNTIANTQIGGWNVAVTENTTVIDNKTVTAAFVSSASEGVTAIDLESVIASFVTFISENSTFIDSPYGRGWFIINDNQTITWVQINNSQ
jgi:hypothetical protein